MNMQVEYKIKDICQKILSGGTPNTRIESYYNGSIPWLNTKEIDFNRIYSTEKTITDEGLVNSSAKWVPKHSVIVAMYGATAAKVAYTEIDLTTNQACCNLVVDPAKADSRYVYYYLKNIYSELGNLAIGAAQQNLSVKVIGEFPISLPSMEEQKRIAGILSALDDKIELNRRINANLELQAQTLFNHWFVDFEFPNADGKPYKSSGGKLIDSSLGLIPAGWQCGRLGEISEIVGGGTPSKANTKYFTQKGIAWITPKDLSVNKCKFISKGETDISEIGYQNSSAKLMPRGSVLFSSRAPIGYIAIAKNEICTNQGFKSAVPKIAGTAFLYYFMKLNTQEIESKASGSTFKEASGSLMKSLPVIIPPVKLLAEFEHVIKPIFDKQEQSEDENIHLAQFRDILLPKLMNGACASK